MVVRVSGTAQQGVWVEREVLFLQIESDNSDWVETTVPETDGELSGTQQVLAAVEQYATILGVTFGSADDLWIMVGYGSSFIAGQDETSGAGTTEARLAADIDAISSPVAFGNTDVATFNGFSGIAQDVLA